MATPEGRVLNFDGPEKINIKVLETFPYEGPRQNVTYSTQEFSAVCPFSGLPDLGTLRVKYIPRSKCVELKSLKYYLLSYRNVGIYQEPATARIFKDLWAVIQPEVLEVSLDYKTRGGIDTLTSVSSLDQK